MKSTHWIIALACFTLGILTSTRALSQPADIQIQVNAPATAFSFLGITARNFRQTTIGTAYQESYSVVGARVIHNITMSQDFATPLMQNVLFPLGPKLPPGNYTYEIVERGVNVPERRSEQVSFTVPPPEVAPVSATVLYERALKKFYVTAKPDEVSLLLSLNTSNNTQWIVIDDNIRVWTAPQPFTVPVCRLFIASVSRHFFSADDFNECRVVRQLAGTVDEGAAFHAIPPLRKSYLDGIGEPPPPYLNMCPLGTDPVYRSFSSDPATIGHRYSSNAETVRQLQLPFSGESPYKLELVAFCTPRS
jgi:hypothetical protein